MAKVKRCEQTLLFIDYTEDTCHWRSKVGEDCSSLLASSSQWSSSQELPVLYPSWSAFLRVSSGCAELPSPTAHPDTLSLAAQVISTWPTYTRVEEDVKRWYGSLNLRHSSIFSQFRTDCPVYTCRVYFYAQQSVPALPVATTPLLVLNGSFICTLFFVLFCFFVCLHCFFVCLHCLHALVSLFCFVLCLLKKKKKHRHTTNNNCHVQN